MLSFIPKSLQHKCSSHFLHKSICFYPFYLTLFFYLSHAILNNFLSLSSSYLINFRIHFAFPFIKLPWISHSPFPFYPARHLATFFSQILLFYYLTGYLYPSKFYSFCYFLHVNAILFRSVLLLKTVGNNFCF